MSRGRPCLARVGVCAGFLVLGASAIPASGSDGAPVALLAHGADPALHVAGASRDVGAALGSSSGLTRPLSMLATPAAGQRAEAALRDLGTATDLADEIRALYVEAGVDPSPADLAALELRVTSLPDDEADRLAQVVRAIRHAARMIDESLEGLSSGERDELEQLLTEASDALADDHVDAAVRAASVLRFEELARRVDLDGISAAAMVVTSTLEPTLRSLLATACGVPGPVVTPFSDPTGLIVVGTAGPDSYVTPTILLIEPAGDDVYELANRAGGVAPGDFPVSVVIDFDGNDSYHSGGTKDVLLSYVQGAAGLGVGALVDVCGDDAYASGHVITGPALPQGPPVSVAYDLFRSQGHGALGVGILVDAEGDDDYASRNRLRATAGFASYHTAYVQGSGHFGIGLLVDALGRDSYSSENELDADSGTNVANAVGDPVSTFSTEFCQGAGLSLGAGVLLEGTDYSLVEATVPDGRRLPPPGIDLSAGSDAYNSNNVIRATSKTIGGHGGQTNVYSLICQGASGAPYPSSTGRPGDPGGGQAGAPPPPEGFGVAVGILVDGSGDDLYNSTNELTSSGTDSGSVKAGKCRTCHVPAVFNVRVNQGASGAAAPPPDWREIFGPPFPGYQPPQQPPPAPQPAPAGLIGIAHVGILVDGVGSDQYNSSNRLLADGYDTDVNFSPICAHADYQVIRSQGFGGNEDLAEAITGEGCQPGNPGGGGCKGGDGRPCPPSLSQACVGPGRDLKLPGVDAGVPVALSLPVLPGCFAGVLVDGHGDDSYNSRNDLEAKDADSVYASYIVDVSQGSGLAQGVGVAVDALLSADGTVTPSLCGSPLVCADPGSQGTRLGTTNDEYNSGNDARVKRSPSAFGGFETEVWSITRSLGSGGGGYGVFADAGLLGVGSFSVATALGTVSLGFPSSDRYNSDNGCAPYFLFDSSSFGYAGGGAAAFVEAFGDDRYEQNACSVLTLESYGYARDNLSLGVPPSLRDVAVFADLWGLDTYPASVFPAPVPLLGAPIPPADNAVWRNAAPGIGLGIDLLPGLP